MADFRLTTVLSTLVLLLVYVCQSCSPPESWRPPPTLVDSILTAHVVLYGQVRARYPDKYTESAYTIELEVYCILKGPRTPLVINITGAGWIPGHCESSTYLVNDDYVVRAYNRANTADEPLQLTISSTHINATEEALTEITRACGLNPVTRPTASTSNLECPVSVTDCQSEPTPDIERPTPSPPKENVNRDGVPKLETRDSTSAAIITVATTTLAATAAAAAMVLNNIS